MRLRPTVVGGVVLAHRSERDAGWAIESSERLQVLFTLVRMRWRVLAATDLRIPHRRAIAAGGLDELDDEPQYPGELGFVSRLVEATARFGAGELEW